MTLLSVKTHYNMTHYFMTVKLYDQGHDKLNMS